LLYTITVQNIVFLVSNSCRANGKKRQQKSQLLFLRGDFLTLQDIHNIHMLAVDIKSIYFQIKGSLFYLFL